MSTDETDLASRRLLAVTEEELSRIVLDIHDGPVQYLFAALSLLTRMQQQAAAPDVDPAALRPPLDRVTGLVEDALHEIRSFLGTFRPPEFQRRAVSAIVHGLVIQHEERTGHTVDLNIDLTNDNPPLPVKIALYRILQEALSNAYRHAGVNRQQVGLSNEGEFICLTVMDQGKGFAPPPMEGPTATEREEHIGLRGMRDRVKLLGGVFQLQSRPGLGTTITVKLPAYASREGDVCLNVFE